MRRRLVLSFAPLLTALAVACADKATAPNGTANGDLTPPPADTETVGVVVEDFVLSGRLFGPQHDTVVVLSHMRSNDQTAWYPFAQTLAANGYAALAFDFRGYGASGGSEDFDKLDEDLEAVISYLRDRGRQKIFLVGASMGGTTSLVVARDDVLAGVVALSPPAEFDSQNALDAVADVTEPKLFLASEDDAPALDFESLIEAAADPKEIEMFAGNAHGTDLIDPSKNTEAAAVGQRILDFLREQSG